jgi:phosphatidate cytidylyltransferase
MSESAWRVLTALVAVPVVIGTAYLGGWAFGALVGAIALAAQWELYGMARAAGYAPQYAAGLGLGALVVAQALWPEAGPLAVLVLVGLLAASPFVFPQETVLPSLAITTLGALYPAGTLSFLVRLRAADPVAGAPDVVWIVLLLLFLVWATDTFAYYVGRALGRRPLAPTISPNKTWEGSIGGVALALVVAVGFKVTVLQALAWGHLLALVVLAGVVGQTGDLAESQIKRSVGLDDASELLPGHGGFLDRFDAMAIAAPLVYLYLDHVARLF